MRPTPEQEMDMQYKERAHADFMECILKPLPSDTQTHMGAEVDPELITLAIILYGTRPTSRRTQR